MTTYRRFPLNVVSENLETLGALDYSLVNLPLKINTSFRRLKRICIFTRLDYLGQILQYCDNLTYLLIVGSFIVDESELQENLSYISALKLQTLVVILAKGKYRLRQGSLTFKERQTCLLRDSITDRGRKSYRDRKEGAAVGVVYSQRRVFSKEISRQLFAVIRATFRHLEKIDRVVGAFYRRVKLPADRIISKFWVAMAIPTLYDMCQFQTTVNMRAGLWSQCQENPFTKVPPKLLYKLWEFIFSMNFRQLPNHEALHLLLTSHRKTEETGSLMFFT
ncbi:hypothetical protein CEXT_298251 [Caerostris extrusa]|uniref:Maturase K n=1 Tax=Caerostris extrusa TaxID=172846 RepID=A0AAV4X039_CAEEX|nr:hypothetical protein CEXT_298251 [Caerostris extrusa]